MAEGVTTTILHRSPGERFQTLRRDLGVKGFGLNLLRLEPGQRGRVHAHERQEEVYVVLDGELTLLLEDEEVVVGRDGVVRVAAHVRRQLVNRGPEPLRLLAIGAQGEHQGRDGIAWTDWDQPREAGRPPQEVPLPDDL
jgi:uncharacterized cupin superfamily protein